MINKRLSDIAVQAIEKNIFKNLDIGNVVKKCSAAYHNRRIMLYKKFNILKLYIELYFLFLNVIIIY